MQPFVTRTVGDVVSEMLMCRTAFRGSLFVLEGDSDSKFFSRRVVKTHSQIVIAGGKTTVCGAVLRAYHIGQTGILGAIDDDYDSIFGLPIPSADIVRTDARDIESLLLRSPALELVIHELGDHAKITAFETAEGVTVREALVRRGLFFGKLRLLDRQNGWKFNFDDLSPWRFADQQNWTIDESAVIAFISARTNSSPTALASSLAAIVVHDPFAILHGRDTANILAMGLRSALGNHQHHADQICQMLRLAFDDAMAAASNLFQQIKSWEAANAPYRVLA